MAETEILSGGNQSKLYVDRLIVSTNMSNETLETETSKISGIVNQL